MNLLNSFLSYSIASSLRLMVFIFLMGTGVFSTAGQVPGPVMQRKISLHGNGIPLGDVLLAIARTADFNIAYDTGVLPSDSVITFHFENTSVHDILTSVLPSSVKFSVNGNNVILLRNIYRQTHQAALLAKVRVLDEKSGMPLPGVLVKDISHHEIASSNEEGFFTVKRNSASEGSFYLSRQEYWDTLVSLDLSKSSPEIHIRKMELFITRPDEENVSGTITPLRSLDNAVPNLQHLTPIEKKEISSITQSIFQFSLLPGIGTQGKRTATTENIISINMLAGKSYGARVFEIGGLNINRSRVTGFQTAATANITGNHVRGAQIAGLWNRTSGTTSGFQIAGAINHGKYKLTGVQIAGVANLKPTRAHGLQMAGLYNQSHTLKGVQISGLINKTDSIAGFQASVINHNKIQKGFSIGIVNVADTMKGLSLGLFNYYRSGRYMAVGFSATDLLPAQLTFKVGARKFYNIYSLMAGYRDDFILAYGAGFGKIIMPWTQTGLVGELTYHRLIYYTSDQPLQHNLGQLSFLFFRNRGQKFTLALGPTMNLLHFKNVNPASGELPPYTLASWQSTNSRAIFWAGAQISVQYNIW